MQSSCISTRRFEETCTIYKKSESLQIFMGSYTEDTIDKFLIHFYKDLNVYRKHQMKEEANLFLIMLNYCIIIFKEQTLEELNHT